MKTEIKFTPYQQSLVDQSKQPSRKMLIRRWANIILVALVASLMLARSYEALPKAIDGWLVLAVAVYIVFNWAAVAGLTFVWGLFGTLKFFMNKAKEGEPPIELQINGQVQKMEDRSRNAVATFVKTTSFFSSTRFSVGRILDIVADWFLFSVLVTVNHPYMALLHGGSLLLQYFLHKKIVNVVTSLVSMLTDPLEETEKTDIDDLMDKLCNPEDGKK